MKNKITDEHLIGFLENNPKSMSDITKNFKLKGTIYSRLNKLISLGRVEKVDDKFLSKLTDKNDIVEKKIEPKKVVEVEKEVTEKEAYVDVKQDDKFDIKQYIPQKNGEYITRQVYGTTDLKLIESLYSNRDFVLIEGETGCGKTHLLRHFCYEKKLPYMRVNLNGATTPEDLVGQWIPNSDPNNKSKYVWKDGVLTTFMRNGGVFVADELNMTPADINSIFHSVTDDEKRLVLTQKNGEVIHAHKDFWLAATVNPDYEGTKTLNPALRSRFRILVLEYNEKVEQKLKIEEKFLEVAKKLRESDEITTPVSTRELLQYKSDSEHYGEKVARNYFINKFDEVEKFVVRELFELIVDNKAPEVKSQDEPTTSI